MKDRRLNELLDLKSVLETAHGRRVIMRMVHELCRKDAEPMTGNSQTFFNLGARSIGLRIHDDCIEAHRALYRKAEDEHYSKAVTDASERQQQTEEERF